MATGALTEQRLLDMNRAQLDALFADCPAGAIPNGRAQGTAIMVPGTVLNAAMAQAVRLFAWKGKTIDAQRGSLRNRISPFGVHAIAARVYEGPSWFDGKPCIVLDYSKTSLVARFIRDEIRLVAPGFYLGKVYWGKRPTFGFCLQF
jgi:hypothetical protein